jgi:hypothetical protein
LIAGLLWLHAAAAAPVAVRFPEGLTHGFLVLRTLAGRMPPDSHAWIVTDELPAFVRFEGPLHPAGPAWRIELASPRWPDERATAPAAP